MNRGKGVNPMVIGGLVLGLVTVGIIVYFVFFRNKKDDKKTPTSGGGTPTTSGGGTPTSGGGNSGGGNSGGGFEGLGLNDSDILNFMGNQISAKTVSAYSLRRQHPMYQAPLVTLRKRYAGGQDITAEFMSTSDGTGLVGTGAASGQSIDDWAGGSDVTLVKWWDQSGNGRHASPTGNPVTLFKTQATRGKPSYWAFDFSGSALQIDNGQSVPVMNNISIYSNASPKLHPTAAKLMNFGSTPTATIFVFNSDIDVSYKWFLEQDRNPPLRKIPQ